MSLSQRTIGLTTKFLPFVSLLIILFWTNPWIKNMFIWLGSVTDVLILAIAVGAGIVVIAEGFTQKNSNTFGAIVGAVLFWIVGSVLILTGVMQVTGIYDILTGDGINQAFISVFWVLATILFFAMSVFEIAVSGKFVVTAPHRIYRN